MNLRAQTLLFFLLITICAPAFAGPNLLMNGSFEDGLNGWTRSGTQSSYQISVIVTDGVSGTAFGEAVPADYITGGSPDLAGNHGVYFVDDRANQTLSQSVFLSAGHYEIGFDAYAPLNGFRNHYDAYFNGTIAEVELAEYTVHTQNQPKIWLHYAGLANILVGGAYMVDFNFQTNGVPAADVVIDRVYIVSSQSTGGITIPSPATVPEPASLLLMGTGLGVLCIAIRRKRY